MLDGLYVAATGMQAEQTRLDNISNNLANINTPAYKKSRVNFDELMYADATNATDLQHLNGNALIGLGSAVSSVTKSFSPGDLKQSKNPFDIAISGDGLYEVRLPGGDYAYTRTGSFKVDADGYLATQQGYRLSSNINVPVGATEMTVTPEGEVLVAFADTEDPQTLGRIQLAQFMDAGALEPVGEGLYLPNAATGQPTYADPGQGGVGELKQGFLESSNVNLVEEMVDLVLAQRAYEVNSQVIRASDEMLKITNSLRS